MTVNAPLSSSFHNLKTEVGKFAQVSDWKSAVQLIEEFLKTYGDSDKRVFELLGDCCYNLAFQQTTRDEFKKVILRAEEAYERIIDDNRCKGRASFCKYWASDNPDERRKIIVSECLPTGRELVAQLDASSERDERIVSRGYVELLEYLFVACSISSDRKQLVELVNEAKSVGKNAFSRFKTSSNPETVISIAHSYVLFLEWEETNFIRAEELQKIGNEIVAVFDILLGFGDKVEDWKFKSLAYGAVGFITGQWKDDFIAGSSLIEKALLAAEKTGDKNLVGQQFQLLSFSLGWAAEGIDIPEQRREFLEKAVEYSSRAVYCLQVPLEESGVANRIFVQRSVNLARDVPQVPTKLDYLNRAIDFGKAGLPYATYFPMYYLEIWPFLASALTYKAELTPRKDERETLLSEAVDLTVNCLHRFDSLLHADSWNRGVMYWYAGVAKARLSDEKNDDSQERESLLKESASDLKEAAGICARFLLTLPSSPSESRVGKMCEDLGSTFVKLYDVSHRRDDCLSAIKAYEEATLHYSRANLIGFVAPITWKTARLYDSISEYPKSASAFTKASQQYQAASRNQKSLQKSFADLSLYMQAWSNIEEARLLHIDEKYESASEKLRDASDVLTETEDFRYLTKHYEAFSKMEKGEELSRKESNIEASSSFGEAYDLFEQAKNEALTLVKERASDETELKQWARLSESRGKYCLARKDLDEAKSLDKSGEVKQSISNYRSAAETFGQLEQEGADEQDRTELKALSLECEAWATMKEAEYSASPELYAKAAESFMEARNTKVRQSFILSCLANAAICRAFEAGTRFKETKDVQLYSQIKKQLGTASQYYEEAGFEIASDWTGATEALFDALVYLVSAEGEVDPSKKTQMYHLAEKHLELSARRYGDIGYGKKRAEVLRQLKKARENREVLISPTEALSQNPTVSATPVNFTRDQASGLERFEVANITGNIGLAMKSVNVGSSIRMDIELANVGKTPALLMKLDNIAEQRAFDYDHEKNQYHFHEGDREGTISIDLKGRRLEYLKAHEMSVFLNAKSKGSFELKPRVVFVDELGKYRSYEFEPQNIEVKELGFMGWAKGK